MKTNDIKLLKRMPIVAMLILFITGIGLVNVWGCVPEGDTLVQQAFELRMEGRVDEALTLVNFTLEQDSTNALAHLEKYRILDYMMTGGGDISLDDMFSSIEKAAKYDNYNVIIAYQKAKASFLKAYINVDGDDKALVEVICQDFKHVLELQPDQSQAMLYLVEIYSQLPPDMGGDMEKAERYAALLKQTDDYFAAKAELLINPQDEIEFWLTYIESHDKTADLLTDIGSAYIYEEDLENAEKYYKEAIALDPERNYLILNMARYYMYQVMGEQAAADSVLPLAANYINMYLDSKPTPNVPMRAYALGMLAKTKMFTGQKEEGMELVEEAKKFDPYFSRASGLPGQSKFDPPDKIKPEYSSFFKPF